MAEDKEVLGVEDLKRVFIRAQDDTTKRWVSISCYECSDLQFDTWAKSRIPIQGEDAPWSLSERAAFCNQLYQASALHILKKDIELERQDG